MMREWLVAFLLCRPGPTAFPGFLAGPGRVTRSGLDYNFASCFLHQGRKSSGRKCFTASQASTNIPSTGSPFVQLGSNQTNSVARWTRRHNQVDESQPCTKRKQRKDASSQPNRSTLWVWSVGFCDPKTLGLNKQRTF